MFLVGQQYFLIHSHGHCGILKISGLLFGIAIGLFMSIVNFYLVSCQILIASIFGNKFMKLQKN